MKLVLKVKPCCTGQADHYIKQKQYNHGPHAERESLVMSGNGNVEHTLYCHAHHLLDREAKASREVTTAVSSQPGTKLSWHSYERSAGRGGVKETRLLRL